jgi:NADPH:quinone reductase-like Zn-dependent oxidoreductase
VINYNEDKQWGKTAKGLTYNGQGVDHIIEVGGGGTLEQSLAAIRFEGVISIIGFLSGGAPPPAILEVLSNICTTRGVYVGSRALMEDMVAAIEANDIHPVMDKKEFTLAEARDAYEYMVSSVSFEVTIKFTNKSLLLVEAIAFRQDWHQH